jgi:hypothetical protein
LHGFVAADGGHMTDRTHSGPLSRGCGGPSLRVLAFRSQPALRKAPVGTAESNSRCRATRRSGLPTRRDSAALRRNAPRPAPSELYCPCQNYIVHVGTYCRPTLSFFSTLVTPTGGAATGNSRRNLSNSAASLCPSVSAVCTTVLYQLLQAVSGCQFNEGRFFHFANDPGQPQLCANPARAWCGCVPRSLRSLPHVRIGAAGVSGRPRLSEGYSKLCRGGSGALYGIDLPRGIRS